MSDVVLERRYLETSLVNWVLSFLPYLHLLCFERLISLALSQTLKCCTNVLKRYCCASLRVSNLSTGFKHLLHL